MRLAKSKQTAATGNSVERRLSNQFEVGYSQILTSPCVSCVCASFRYHTDDAATSETQFVFFFVNVQLAVIISATVYVHFIIILFNCVINSQS